MNTENFFSRMWKESILAEEDRRVMEVLEQVSKEIKG